jgi:protein Mpv17
MFFSYVACLEWKGIDYVIDKTKNELMTSASLRPIGGLWELEGRRGGGVRQANSRPSEADICAVTICSDTALTARPFSQVTGSWKVWPLAHFFNFKYIPSSQRVLYINFIQIGYNCFLSIISNRDSTTVKAE